MSYAEWVRRLNEALAAYWDEVEQLDRQLHEALSAFEGNR